MPKLRAKRQKDSDGKEYISYYFMDFYDSSRQPPRKKVSLGTADESAARRIYVEKEREYALKLYDPWTDKLRAKGVTVHAAVIEYLDDQSEHWSPQSYETYEVVLRTFTDSLSPDFPVHGVEPFHINNYLDGKDIAEATRAGYLARIRVFFNWCVDQDIIRENPTPKKRRGKRSRKQKVPEYLTADQFDLLIRGLSADAELKSLKHGNQWLIDAFKFAVHTGLRRGELCNLRWDAIDIEGRMIRVQNTKDFSTKSGRERSVPLVGMALEVIQRRVEKQPKADGSEYVFRGATGTKLNDEYLTKRFRFYRRLAKLPENISLHSLRHTFASWFVQKGGDLYRLKEIMGHADIKTTLKYAHLRPDALTEEMEKCFGSNSSASNDSDTKLLQEEIRRLQAELDRVNRKLAEVRPPA